MDLRAAESRRRRVRPCVCLGLVRAARGTADGVGHAHDHRRQPKQAVLPEADQLRPSFVEPRSLDAAAITRAVPADVNPSSEP